MNPGRREWILQTQQSSSPSCRVGCFWNPPANSLTLFRQEVLFRSPVIESRGGFVTILMIKMWQKWFCCVTSKVSLVKATLVSFGTLTLGAFSCHVTSLATLSPPCQNTTSRDGWERGRRGEKIEREKREERERLRLVWATLDVSTCSYLSHPSPGTRYMSEKGFVMTLTPGTD